MKILYKKDSSIVETIKEFVRKLLGKLREIYKGLDPDSAEARAVREMEDSAKRLYDLFEDMAVDAAKTKREAVHRGNETVEWTVEWDVKAEKQNDSPKVKINSEKDLLEFLSVEGLELEKGYFPNDTEVISYMIQVLKDRLDQAEQNGDLNRIRFLNDRIDRAERQRKFYDSITEDSLNLNVHEDTAEREALISAIVQQIEKERGSTANSKGDVKYSSRKPNAEILSLIKKVKSQNFKANEKVYLNNVSLKIAKRIKELTGIDVTGFRVAVEARQIEHILKDHGKDGKTDHSMSNDEDIAKIEYTIDTADDIILAGKSQAYSYTKYGFNRTAQTIKYKKSIGDKIHYVVQAVPDAKAKTLYIVTAYIENKKEASQLINAQGPNATSKNGSVVTSTDIITDPEEIVKKHSKRGHKEEQFKIISKANPATDTYHTWIRSAEDIKTFEEALADDDWNDGSDFDPDYTWEMAQTAIQRGEIIVYSSYPIEQGVFVTPSAMEAESYSGDGQIYRKTVNLDEVAWIDPTQGMYANTKSVMKSRRRDVGSDSEKIKYSLRQYSTHQIENWSKSERIVICNGFEHIKSFVEKSISGEIQNKKMYFGMVPEGLASRISASCGLNVENYNVSLSSNEIRKINKDHGNEKTESLRGQRAVTSEDYVYILEAVQNPDNISLSDKDFFGKPVIQFERNTDNRITVAAVVSDKHLDLFIQTAYIGTKKGNLATPTTEQAVVNTSKTSSGTVSVNSISQDDTESQEDFLYSRRRYTYEALTSKPDMVVTRVSDRNIPTNRADVVKQAKLNAAKVGKYNPGEDNVTVYVDDIDRDVVLSANGLKHSLDRRTELLSPIILKTGEILKNSIKINEMTPEHKQASGSYILIGIAENTERERFITRFVVNEFTNEIDKIDVLYAVNAKKESVAQTVPEITANTATRTSDSTISISELLDYVNRYFPDILPEDVLKHYGYESRPEGKLGESVLYSRRRISNREILADVLEGTIDTTTKAGENELRYLNEYRESLAAVEELESELVKLQRQVAGERRSHRPLLCPLRGF